ncbi:hypothetical protein COV17_02575 [Candidatus Woesearchaeota archaeon CG10_big_fil_rev_8_21_14_0_10_36_11]|nr:MAG: hypothetical protein COV17_02575 [Candidatus Woesearchaeota archaeon CG10_big_fil_rev_8_21_14_0_10_36_11]
MMKSTILVMSVLVVLSLVLTSCSTEETQTQIAGAFIGGTQGIVAEFEPFGVEEEGVSAIFDTETFLVEVTLRNKGEYEIQPGDIIVKLLGPSQSEFGGIADWELQNSGIIERISELVTSGGEETISFADNAQYEGDVNGLLDREWFANVEYKYNTFLVVPEVCLKEDLTDERVCDVKEDKHYSSSGGPITVTSVTEDTAGKGIIALKIKIKNAGIGKVTMPTEEFSSRKNTLSFSLDDPAWECKSGGKINEARLVDGEAEILCKLLEPLSEGTLETKKVKLTMDYKYRDIIQETLRIKESAE